MSEISEPAPVQHPVAEPPAGSAPRAHPNGSRQIRGSPSLRSLKLEVYDFGDEKKNRAFDELVRDTTRRLARIVADGD